MKVLTDFSVAKALVEGVATAIEEERTTFFKHWPNCFQRHRWSF
jgi:hypothetical protein